MNLENKNFIARFWERNLFERIIIYIFISELSVKIIFELMLGQGSFFQSQNVQWIFFSLLSLDYAVSFRKILNIRVTINPMSILAFVFFIMLAHGLFIGIMNHNNPFIILNDTVPLLMMALNILRMQSSYETQKPIDVKFILAICTGIALGTCFLGFLAVQLGQPSQPSIGRGSIYYPLLMASLFMLRPFPKYVAVIALIMIALTISDFNRTTMAFLAVTIGGYIMYTLLKDPVKGVLAIMAVLAFVSLSFLFLPKDSKTYARIVSLSEIDLSERTGSIGERQAEWDAIQLKLAHMGKTAEWTGMGFGGVYNVKFTHTYLVNYGHAHYIWAWYNLRFGKIGYLYMAILINALLYNGIRGLHLANDIGLFVSFLCLLGLLYCLTHVNSVFLLSGLHFFHLKVKGHGRQKIPERFAMG